MEPRFDESSGLRKVNIGMLELKIKVALEIVLPQYCDKQQLNRQKCKCLLVPWEVEATVEPQVCESSLYCMLHRILERGLTGASRASDSP
ncbi:hypothetical protein B566_EDAN016700 [Ephemera danica]|nr:hypothetical protein B566_EDAN016700 [Ephemera danica]